MADLRSTANCTKPAFFGCHNHEVVFAHRIARLKAKRIARLCAQAERRFERNVFTMISSRLTERQRYGGRGVMIYWHVDKRAKCTHLQLKQVSSSEVASTIEGVLHHATDIQIERQFVDTHGQSVVGFAFCYLLGFNLMLRLKGIARQKLVRADPKSERTYANPDPIFVPKTINWYLIAQHYDEMIKLATTLKLRTAEPETILRRFTRGQSPLVFAALLELGKAAKTIFLCKYPGDKDLRRE